MTEDITDICDRLQDQTRAIDKLAKVVAAREAPVVNVAAPSTPSPSVNVAAPSVTVSAPSVTIEKPTPVKWVFTVTKRDHRDRIETFTATPAT